MLDFTDGDRIPVTIAVLRGRQPALGHVTRLLASPQLPFQSLLRRKFPSQRRGDARARSMQRRGQSGVEVLSRNYDEADAGATTAHRQVRSSGQWLVDSSAECSGIWVNVSAPAWVFGAAD